MKRALWVILLAVFCVLTGEAQTLRLTSPNGGESWEQGTVRAITWTSSGITARVRLILFKDGARLGQIADDLDIAAGSFSWTVGNYGRETAAAGGGYKVRIRTVDGDVVDNSNAPFTITAPGSPSLSKLPPTAVKRKQDAVTLPPTALKKWEPVDLAITKVRSEYMPGLCALKAEVKCLKGRFSGPVVFSVDYGWGPREIKKISHNLDIGLNETQTVDLRRVEPITVWAGNPCTQKCTVTVDCDNLIAETDESNNSLTADVPCFVGNPRILPPIRIGRGWVGVEEEGQEVGLLARYFRFGEDGHRRAIAFGVPIKNCGCGRLNCSLDVWQRGRWPDNHEITPRDQEHLVGEWHGELAGGDLIMATFDIDIYMENSEIEVELRCSGPIEGPPQDNFFTFYIRMR